MGITEEFKKEISPFTWVEYKGTVSVCLNAGEYLQEIFDALADKGFEGGGYDWESLAACQIAVFGYQKQIPAAKRLPPRFFYMLC